MQTGVNQLKLTRKLRVEFNDFSVVTGLDIHGEFDNVRHSLILSQVRVQTPGTMARRDTARARTKPRFLGLTYGPYGTIVITCRPRIGVGQYDNPVPQAKQLSGNGATCCGSKSAAHGLAKRVVCGEIELSSGN